MDRGGSHVKEEGKGLEKAAKGELENIVFILKMNLKKPKGLGLFMFRVSEMCTFPFHVSISSSSFLGQLLHIGVSLYFFIFIYL